MIVKGTFNMLERIRLHMIVIIMSVMSVRVRAEESVTLRLRTVALRFGTV